MYFLGPKNNSKIIKNGKKAKNEPKRSINLISNIFDVFNWLKHHLNQNNRGLRDNFRITPNYKHLKKCNLQDPKNF